MKIISSLQNSEIKDIVKLRDKKIRYEKNLFMAEGLRTCRTLIESNIALSTLYTTENLLAQATVLAPQKKIIIVSDMVMKKISNTTTPSGVVGLFDLPKKQDPVLLTPGLVLVNITNPGNMGTLIRSAAAMNAQTIVIIDGADPFCPKVVQATAGTIGLVSIFQLSWQELLMHKQAISLCALVPHGGSNPNDIALTNSLLVVGNESHGMQKEQVADCEQMLSIPMPGNTESLNVAIAGSIALYLVAQQKHYQR